MKHIWIALGTAAALTAGAAVAQEADRESWSSSVAVIQESVAAELAGFGISYDTDDLTIRQLNELELVFADDGSSDANKKLQVEQIIGSN